MTSSSTPKSSQPKLLLVGCGGIGGCIASRLVASGTANLTLLSSNEVIARKWQAKKISLNGLKLESQGHFPSVVCQPQALQGIFDFILLAVPPAQLSDLASNLSPFIGNHSRIICLSNGLGEAHLAEVLGHQKIYGAVVSWGARMQAPGEYIQTSKGSFSLGAYRPGQLTENEPQLLQAKSLLEQVAPVFITQNLAGARFSKLAINCAISTLGTIGGTTLGRLLRQRQARRIGLKLMSEAVLVAKAEAVTLEPVARLDLERLFRLSQKGQRTRRLSQHAVLFAIGRKYRRLRSSTLAAMERGRPPSVDFLNGEIVDRGRIHEIATPYNQAAVTIVWRIAAGELTSGSTALKELEKIAQASGPGQAPELGESA